MNRSERTAQPRRVLCLALVVLAALGGLYVNAAAAGFAVNSPRLTVMDQPDSVPATTCTASAATDSYADEQRANAAVGSATDLTVGARNNQAKRSLVKFDLAACAIPTAALVLTAELRMYLATAPTTARSYGVHRLTGAFNEAALTWNNQPAAAASATDAITSGTTSGSYLTWRPTADVAAFVADPAANHGWAIRDASEGGTTLHAGVFRSRESATVAQRPTLVVTYYP